MKQDALNQILILLERVEASLVVRDPGNSRSAEAFDGLRKSLLQSSKNRRIHVSHLLSLSDSIERGAEYQLIKDRVSDFLSEMGVSRTSDVSRTEFFEVTGGDGPYLECVVPAVVESLDNGEISLVRLGEAVRTHTPSPSSRRIVQDEPDPTYASVETSSAMAVVVGITIAIIGFFLGWVIASIGHQDAEVGSSHVSVVVTESRPVGQTQTREMNAR